MRKSRQLLTGQRHELKLPNLGVDDVPIVATTWMVELGEEVTEGDRMLEVVAGSVSVDLPTPASGILAEVWVEEDEQVKTGQLLAVVVEV